MVFARGKIIVNYFISLNWRVERYDPNLRPRRGAMVERANMGIQPTVQKARCG
jgi:hypothetical protein